MGAGKGAGKEQEKGQGMVSGWTNAFIFTTNRVIFRTNSAIFRTNPVIPGTYPVMLKGFYGEKSYHIIYIA